MRADRLLAEVIYLLEHGRVPAQELARRFEVSPRTVLRDMEALGMAGIPVASFEGAGGGLHWRSATGWITARRTRRTCG